MFESPQLDAIKPIIDLGVREDFIDTYFKIFGYVNDEKPGFQQVSSALVMKLLGCLVSMEKQLSFSETRIEKIIQKACCVIRENVQNDIDFRQFAESNSIAYSYFRKMFKIYTGLPPAKYQLDLKIIRSKELLLSTDKKIKEICYEVGFESVFYFSRLFKSKVGVSPSQFKTAAQKHLKKRKV